MSEEKDKIRDMVLAASRKGNVVIADMGGPRAMPLDDFITQPADGILYDLNRLEEVVLAFIDDPKWVNDFAVAKTIRALKARIDEMEKAASPTGEEGR